MQNKSFKHQTECVTKAYGRPHFALFLDCGLGKTKIAIDLMKKYAFKKYLVIAPNTVLDNWSEEIEKWSTLSFSILKGTKKKRIKMLHSSSAIKIINYEALRVIEKDLIAYDFDMIVADESQKLKSNKSLQSKAAWRIGMKAKHKLIMTGTPVSNSPLDVFGQYRFLNHFIFGYSYFRFRSTYAVMGGYMNYQVMRWIRIEDMQKKIYSCAVRYTKEECLDLPDKLYEIVKVDMPDEQRRLYEQLKRDFVSEWEGKIIKAAVVLTRMIRFSQITNGFIKDEEGREIPFKVNPKLAWLKEFISDLSQDKKVVIFVRFIRELHGVEELMDGLKVKYVSIYGAIKERQTLINQFNNDKDTRVFIGQIDTAGVGVNLHTAQYCVFMSNTYSYGTRVQAEDRCHRILQTKNVTYIDVVMDKSIDGSIMTCIKNKASMADMVMEKGIGGVV